MKLRGVGDVKEVREIVQHLFTNIVKPQDSRQAKTHVDDLLFQLVDDMHSMRNADSFLDRAQELLKKAIDQHAKYTTAELDRSCPVKKGAATRRRLGEQAAVNMHTMGTSFVAKVRDVRQIAHEQIGEGVAGMVEFKAQVNGYEATEKAKKSKSGAVFWTCSSPTDLTGIDLSHFFWALCGVGSTSQSSRVQDGDKSRAKEGAE